tara:strand:- start:1676 stop:2110 length:435 start_codon:yes stop_codon:yes gene_type:complete
MKVSATKAAKLVGKTTPTITNALKIGKLSGEKRNGVGWEIDTSELFRVWPPVNHTSGFTPKELQNETPKNDSTLQVELKVTQQRLDDAQQTIDDLRTRLDAEAAERRTLTAQLTDRREHGTAAVPVEALSASRSGWWDRLLGRK